LDEGTAAVVDRFDPHDRYVGRSGISCPPGGKNFPSAKGISCVQNRSRRRLDGLIRGS